MRKNFFKRTLAGVLSAVTLVSSMAVSVPTAFAAEEDNKASAIEIKVGETYNVADKGVSKAWFQQNGAPRNVWPMFTKASDGTEIRAYCADHAKGNPGTGGKPYTVTGQVKDMRVYGVVVKSDSRNTLNTFISGSKVLNAGNFTADMYFSASQAAIWCALGDAQIAANSKFGITYPSSTSLGYRSSGKTLSASTTSEALTLYAAIEMLKYGNEFDGVWGSSGKGHAPWVGNTINYTPGSATYNAANAKTGSVDLPSGIVKSGVFAEKSIDGTDYLVLPMAAASATFVRSNRIFVRASNLPSGAFIMDEDGNKNGNDGLLTLSKVHSDKTLYKNGNDMAFGQVFYFCIPKSTAEQMDTAGTKLSTSFLTSMNVDRYNVYVASTNSSGIQPVILVEPAVKLSSNKLSFSSTTVPKDKVKLKVMKTDKDGAPLDGCTFQITYTDAGKAQNKTATTDSNGEAIFTELPTNTTVTVKETAAPEGYTLLPSKTVNTGTKGGQTVELKLANSDDHTFKVHKISSADGRNLMGATFEVRGIDNNFKHTYTTDALGEFTIQGRDLPNGSFEVYEVAAPEGYATDGSDIQTFAWDNSKDIELSFKDAPRPGIKIYKYDKDTKMPLAGATFEVRRDGQVLATVKTDVNGNAGLYDLPKGFYQVVETEPPQGYLRDEQVHEVYIDPTADPTQLIREVNIANTKKLSIRIVKIDKETKVPLSGWKFDVYYNDAHLTTVTTNQNGEAMVENLQPGTYRVKETGGDTEHYNMDAGEQTVELVKDQAEIPTLTFANTIKKHFGILKIDSETHKPIEGVTFAIYKDGKLLGNYTTGADGRIWLPYAEPGTYQAQEVITDPKYVLNEKVFTIENNSEYPTFFTIPNVMKKDITVTKIDKDTGKPLQGVVFQGFKDGKSIGYFTTGADGKFTIPYADSGTYTFKEYHTLAGYVLNKEPITIEHTTDGNVDIIVDNTVQKKFEVIKVDSQTKQPLAGVQFKIWRDGVLLGDYTTDENGKIVIEKAPAGTYKVQEVATLKEYILNDKPYEIEHTTDKDTSLTIENTKKPGLSITKIDAETKKPLSGAVFKLTRANGDVVKEDIRTGEDGTAFVEGLDAADYIVTEVTAPGGYIIDKTPHAVSLEQGKTYTLTLENEKKPGLLVKKVDAQTSKPLAGASFKITRGDGSVVRENVVSDVDGVVHIPELDTGVYIITEVKAPSGYEIDETPKTVQLRKGQTYEVTFKDTKQSQLVIKKVDEDTRQPLKNAKFKITKSNGELVKETETDENGTITLTGLPDCSLVVTEIKAPDGYIMQDTPKTIEVKAGGSYELTFTNKKQSGLTIKKIDEETRQPLKNAKFKITKSNGELVKEAETDVNGTITLTGLPDCSLVVTEIAAPTGYILQDTPKTIEVKAGQSYELTFTNKKAYGLQIRKVVKGTGEALAGAKFKVEKVSGERIGEYTSNSAGLVNISGLEDGIYVVTEIKAPDGYRIDTNPKNVIVKAGELATVEFENAKMSSVRIKKIDSVTKDPIPGVRFLIKDKNKNIVGEYTTDSDGYIELENDLEEGKYYAEEIQAAPGYIRDTQERTFRVKRGETTEIVWENTAQYGQIQVIKKSKDYNSINGLPAGTLLQGATFEIYDKAQNVVDTVVSNERGLAISKLLPLGRYTIKETKAPKYYGVSGETFEAEIEFASQIVRLEVLDESVYTNVVIGKSGPKQVTPGMQMKWTISRVANNSSIRLTSFYWRDNLPYQAVQLDKIVTGTYNTRIPYKVVYKTNFNQTPRTLADNLDPSVNRVLQATPTALGLKSGEAVTQIMFIFGTVPSGFRMVDNAYIYGTVRKSASGSSFVNKADVGGLNDSQQWIMSNDAWTTTIYRAPTYKKPTLPTTGW
ncbi:MSCRAMM family protein [Butyricicoccus sp. OF10-2]|uniref:MSCRAMM family protein n=2 Tax=Butyricicoccaceae TaxID=3085642 RepID=UPI000E5C6A41|nr:SpaA isopeptide-forming pilin-related protein [Butyricicoccus sp. OF10-2]RHV82959.1 hypothetical protein DXB00_09135 [Butyricicoccus sp. OF10-2]